MPGLEGFWILPVAFSQLVGGDRDSSGEKPSRRRGLIRRFRSTFQAGRYWLGPLSASRLAGKLQKIVDQVHPDLVHARRIPYEGMRASGWRQGVPLVVSIWGNDLTLHAGGSALMRSATRRTLRRADGLLADTHRDLDLARQWGFAPTKPALQAPGSGGVRLDEIAAARNAPNPLPPEWMDGRPIIVNPRGIRPGSVRTDTFFKAIPLVHRRFPQASFICPAMAGQPEAEYWMAELGLRERICLLPVIPQEQLWRLYYASQALVSISEHDGTPNSVLEGMACGCFPIAGEIDSLREWIEPGSNGLLVPPGDEAALAEAICRALEDEPLRRQAAERNAEIVVSRADSGKVMRDVAEFYQSLIRA